MNVEVVDGAPACNWELREGGAAVDTIEVEAGADADVVVVAVEATSVVVVGGLLRLRIPLPLIVVLAVVATPGAAAAAAAAADVPSVDPPAGSARRPCSPVEVAGAVAGLAVIPLDDAATRRDDVASIAGEAPPITTLSTRAPPNVEVQLPLACIPINRDIDDEVVE